MSKKDVDDYLQEGIYGAKEINPDEKRKYLGTYRERVLLALTQAQVRGAKGLKELETAIDQNNDVQLLLNGDMSFRFFKPYRDLSRKKKINYTSIANKTATSDYGLVLTSKHAVDKEDIFLKEAAASPPKDKSEKKPWWKKIFGL